MGKNQDQEYQEIKEQDLLTRNREMSEGKNADIAAQILKKGDKYYCAECHSELPIHHDCPGCHAHIDWDRVTMESR
jgi:hypothetical protein